MSIQLFGPFNKIINEAATEVINGEIVHRAQDLVVTVLSSSISLIDSALGQGSKSYCT